MVTIAQETPLDLATGERDSTGTAAAQAPEPGTLRLEHSPPAAATAEDIRRRWAFPPLAAFPATLIR
ncbi:MAG: hypothetical protein Q7U97_04410 [Rhodocyclaceae bacterium]|jgi:hypothetical protein|nr:hypothetical protein [Rhodocyclaceae bacterium]